ncbi:hypothetical protein ACHAXA_005655 [Cyclostephanos tholiformis]|uniref:Wax synthase domain-containing protein n=1 Tax=Cyclostephanos tholiformis TaxID=382380 RepID=A0ABD3RC07_9STRA
MYSAVSFGEWVGRNLLFSDVIESDKRVPCIIFTVPANIVNWFGVDHVGNKFGLLAPRIEFWIALVMVLIMGAIFSTCMSFVMYHFIVLPRKQMHKRKGRNIVDSGITPYLIGFGVIMPICAVLPYYYMKYFCIRSKIIKFLAACAQLTLFFRCSEAMFGFLPQYVDNSLKNLLVYTALPVEVKFDAKGAKKSDFQMVKYNFFNWVKYLFILGLYSSILQAYDYQPYPKNEGPSLLDIKLGTGFSRGQLINNTLVAILFQILLTTFGFGLSFLASLAGVQLVPFMLNPIFESSSPSDFWGRRWNLVVHGILKRGVYKPIRSKYSRLVASVATFIVSGLFHEWLLSVAFQPEGEDGVCYSACYYPGYGRNTLFFVWNALLIGLEYAIGGAAIFQIIRAHLPLMVVSLLVASTALPTAHWFTNDYVRSDFFNDTLIGFPAIIRVYNISGSVE